MPENNVKLEFENLGSTMSLQSKIQYYFYLFEANYSNINFNLDNNLDLLFRPFVKDKDTIPKIASIEEV